MKRDLIKQVPPPTEVIAQDYAYDNLPEVVVIGNSSFVIESLNRAGRSIYGQVVGEKCHKVLRNQAEPCRDCLFVDKGKVGEVNIRYKSKTAKGESIDIIETRLSSNPDRWIAMGRSADVLPAGEINYRDIALALDSVGDGVAILNLDGKIAYANRSNEKLHGFSPGELMGKPFSIFDPPDSDAKGGPRILEETSKGGWGGVVAHVRKDGGRFWVSLKTAPLRDKSGKDVAYLVVLRDVSDMEKSKEQLQKEMGDLEKQLAKESVELTKRFSQLKILQELGKRMVISASEEDIANSAAAALVETMGYSAVGVIQRTESKGKKIYQFIGEHTRVSPGKYGRKINEYPITRAIKQRGAVIERYPKERLSVGIMARSELVVPLMHKEKVIGALVIADPDASRFSDDDISIAQTIADLISISLATCTSGKQILDREQALNLLDDMTLQATSRSDIARILSKTVSRISEITNTQACLIGLLAPDGGIDWVATHGAEEFNRDLKEQRFYHDLLARVTEGGDAYYTNDYLSVPSSSMRDGINLLINSLMISPIRLQNDIIGVIVLINRISPAGFTEETAALVQNLSNHLAVLVHNAEAMASLDYSIKTMNSLLRTTFDLQAATGVPDIHQKVAAMLLDVIPYDAARFYSVKKEGITAVLARNVGDKVDLSGMETTIFNIVKKALSEKKGWMGMHLLPNQAGGGERKISLLALPLIGREDEIGAIVIARSAEKAFTDQDQEVATLFANHTAIALENASLLSREKDMLDDSIQRVKQLESILNLTTSVMSVETQEDAVKNVLSAMASVLGFSKGLILYIVEQGEELACMHSTGFSQYESDRLKAVRIPMGDLLSILDGPGRLVGERTFMLSDKKKGDKAVDEEKIIAALRVLSNLRLESPGDKFIITIEDSQGDLVGVIMLSGASIDLTKSRGSINLLEIYGNLASIALKNVRQFERVIAARAEVETLNDLMTHDINNFTQGVLGYLDMINSDPNSDQKNRDYARHAIEQVESTKRLIENVRKLAWIRSGAQEKMKTYDLGEVVGEALDYVQESYPKKNVNFISTIDTGEYRVAGDEMIQELFINLFSNSVKFTPSNNVPLELNVKTQYEFGKEYWRIEIADHGRGIPEDKKQFVFERFGKQDYTPYGFGLGLSIVRNLTRKYGGRVWVENRVPEDYRKGSRFIVLLPKIEVPEPEMPAPPAPPEEAPSEELKKKVVRKVREPTAKSASSRASKLP